MKEFCITDVQAMEAVQTLKRYCEEHSECTDCRIDCSEFKKGMSPCFWAQSDRNDNQAKNERTLLLFHDYGTLNFLYLQGKDIHDNFTKACNAAEKNGVVCKASEIPEQYLVLYGLTKIPIDILEQEIRFIGSDFPKGVDYATCRYCNLFVNGFCDKYMDTTDPEDIEDCCYGERIHQISYNGKVFQNLQLYVDDQEMDAIDMEEIVDTVIAKMNPQNFRNKDGDTLEEIRHKENYDKALWEFV